MSLDMYVALLEIRIFPFDIANLTKLVTVAITAFILPSNQRRSSTIKARRDF